MSNLETTLLIVFGILSAVLATPDSDALDGEWELVAFHIGGLDILEPGKNDEQSDSKETSLYLFKAGQVSGKTKGQKESAFASYSLLKAEAKRPRQIDFYLKSSMDDKATKVPFKGIYQIKGNRLEIAISVDKFPIFSTSKDAKSTPGRERPKAFDSSERPAKGDKVIVLKFKRTQ